MKTWLILTTVLMAGAAVAQPPGMGEGHDMAARPLMAGDLPVGTVTVRVGRGGMTNAAVGVDVVATVTARDGKVSKRTEKVKEDGRATFAGLPVGALFRAETAIDGESLQTAAFDIPSEGGARLMLVSRSPADSEKAEAAPAAGQGTPTNPPINPHAPHAGGHPGAMAEPAGKIPDGMETTSDPSVLQGSNSSKMMIDRREEALEIMENLVLENTAKKVFLPGQSGLPIPLPVEATNAEAIEGGNRLSGDKGSTLFLHDPVPPSAPGQVPVQARFGFFMPTGGESSLTFRQPMPFGLERPVVMLPEATHLTLSAPGVQAMAPQSDDHGRHVQIYQLASVPRNGVLVFTLTGLPTRGTLGKSIAGVLTLALFLAASLSLRRPKALPAAAQLTRRREQLFAELVEATRQAAGPDDGQSDKKRAELVADIEAVDLKLADHS
ncbi:MAG TPA: hypothetical protein VF518_01850 [Polyangia bacterium]